MQNKKKVDFKKALSALAPFEFFHVYYYYFHVYYYYYVVIIRIIRINSHL